ncbi:MAG: lytic transglycosylase domain-containing protein [Sarcina sp.]
MKKKSIVISVIIILAVVFVAIIAKKEILPNKYNGDIQKYSSEFGVNPFLVKGIIKTESNYNPNAISNKNAKGLMQITNETGEWIASKLGVKNFTPEMLYNPKINIEFGCWYIKNLENEFGEKNVAIAAYNAGRTNVENWLNNRQYSINGKDLQKIPFNQTANYVKKVDFYEHAYTLLK